MVIKKLQIHWVQKRSGRFAVHELKGSFVQEHGLYLMTGTPLTTLSLNTINETFQMRYYIKVFFKGIRNTKGQTSRLLNLYHKNTLFKKFQI